MDQDKHIDVSDLYEQLVDAHPTLLRLLVWQQGALLLDSSNAYARLDAETNLLKKFANAIIHLMPFMRSPLSDFHGELKNVRSVTKTITSLLAGLVFGKDILAHLEDPIRLYFPEIPADDPKATIRLKHLLSNTSGLPTVDDLKSMRKLLSTANWLQTILHYPLQDQPGRNHCYSSANFHLANCLLERVLDSNLLHYAGEHFFHPLGIHDLYWACDPQGVPFGGSDLYLRAEDMLKIGILCYQHGKWEGKQIIAQQWLDAATRPVIKVNDTDQYGYGWWVDHNVVQGCLPSFSACGVGGQRIIVIPSQASIVISISLTSLHAHSSMVDDLVCAYFSK